MSRRLVWLLTLAGAVAAAATASAQQFRNYGDSYSAAPDYYDGGPFSGPGNGWNERYGGGRGAGGRDYGGPAYGDRGYGGRDYGGRDYGGPGGYDPYDAPPRRPRNQQGYRDQEPDGPYAVPRYGRSPAYEERGYGYGYDQGPAPDSPESYGRGPASDADLGESSNRTTVTEVANNTHQPPGTIVINTEERHLYYTQANGQALQYGIGVGRQGFTWKGTAKVQRKAEWPAWIPPSDMLKRRPDLPSRMEGGMENPLGARAMYLFQGNKDTMFRIHGTNEPDTIGKAVSSGCIRMMNADVIDLYKRVPVGTKVVVL